MSNTNTSKNMNIYQKLQLARVRLSEKMLSKSGSNDFQNFNYFELKDFLPEVNIIMCDLELTPIFDGAGEVCTLTIVDSDEPNNSIVFQMRRREINMSNDMQSEGAINTYAKRYLYMNALEICENDIIDARDNRKAFRTNAPIEQSKQNSDKQAKPSDNANTNLPQATSRQRNTITKVIKQINDSKDDSLIRDMDKMFSLHGYSKEDDFQNVELPKKTASEFVGALINLSNRIQNGAETKPVINKFSSGNEASKEDYNGMVTELPEGFIDITEDIEF